MEVLSQSDLAKFLRIHRHTVRRWRLNGKLPKPVLSHGSDHYWTREQAEEIKSRLNELIRYVPFASNSVTEQECSHKIDATQAQERG